MKNYFAFLLMGLMTFSLAACSLETGIDEENMDNEEEVMEEFDEANIDLVKQAFADKYEKTLEEVELNVNTKTNTHMRGLITLGDEPGSMGWFLAAKVDGEWKIVFDGNGSVSCDEVDPYGFPEKMIKDCY